MIQDTTSGATRDNLAVSTPIFFHAIVFGSEATVYASKQNLFPFVCPPLLVYNRDVLVLYRVVYIVFFPSNFVIILNSVSSAAALVFYLPVMCTHTDTEGKQRKVRVRKNVKIFEKKQYFMNTL